MSIKQLIAKRVPKTIKDRIKANFGLSGYPNWKQLIAGSDIDWEAIRQENNANPKGRILIATSTGAHRAGNITESALAASLMLRGYCVDVLLCDGVLPGCIVAEYQYVKTKLDVFFSDGPKGVGLCEGCHKQADKMWTGLGVNVLPYSKYLDAGDRANYANLSERLSFNELLEYRDDSDRFIGEHAKSGALRFLCKGELVEGDHESEQALRRYFNSSLVTAKVITSVLDANRYDSLVCFHGIYVPHGVIGDVARSKDVHVVNWNTSYRKRRFIFSHGDTYHKTMAEEQESDWYDYNFTTDKLEHIDNYLKGREQGSDDWQQFNENPEEAIAKSPALRNLDMSKPIVTLLPNVVWDAQLHYSSNVFSNLVEWALFTVRHFANRDDIQLVVRIHPAEIKRFSPSRQPLEAEIRRVFPDLPENIFIVPADDNVSTYRLAEVSNSILIYGTKTGIELTSRGQNVVVCGEAWIKNKGFTHDPRTPEEYEALLQSLPFSEDLSEDQIDRAKRFAYHFFTRRAIYLDFLKETSDAMSFRLNIQDVRELGVGKHEGLDAICDGLTTGSRFILDD